MERREHDRILRLSLVNPELRRLYQKHEQLEAKLSKFAQRPYLTSREEQEEKKLKKEKLAGVDKMLGIINQRYAVAA